MNGTALLKEIDFKEYLLGFNLDNQIGLFDDYENRTEVETIEIDGKRYSKFINEYWTSRQRQASTLHEISYRACFKAQLPRFFINLFTNEGDIVYDPFSGRGTTAIESALMGRNVISNDINPLSKILSAPRLAIPSIYEIKERLNEIHIDRKDKAEIDLSMFYHHDTEAEIVSLKKYLYDRQNTKKEDYIDSWIRMVATNRLTGHSKGFFSVYTLPPNQAILPENQRKINEKRNQIPSYRNTKELIIRKSKSLANNVSSQQRIQLSAIAKKALFLAKDARWTNEIPDESVQLTVTSPPFLDVIQYIEDNWLRCWFNNINIDEVEKNITITKSITQWCNVISDVFKELYRITQIGGCVAFEVGEIKDGKIKLDEYVIPLGVKAGFCCEGIIVNRQSFTKTSNIWGVKNNAKGTNTNRIVVFSNN
ncbi:MAG: DNA methyltransferase [Candidatus Poribacteria bacterium]